MENENKNVVVEIPQKKKESKKRLIGKIILRIFIFISLVILDLISIYSCKVQQEYQNLLNGSDNISFVNRNNNNRKYANDKIEMLNTENLVKYFIPKLKVMNTNNDSYLSDNLVEQCFSCGFDSNGYFSISIKNSSALFNIIRGLNGNHLVLDYIYYYVVEPIFIDNTFYTFGIEVDSNCYLPNEIDLSYYGLLDDVLFDFSSYQMINLSYDDGVMDYPQSTYDDSSYNDTFNFLGLLYNLNNFNYGIGQDKQFLINSNYYFHSSLNLDDFYNSNITTSITLYRCNFSVFYPRDLYDFYSYGNSSTYEKGYSDAEKVYTDTINNLNETIKSITDSYQGKTYIQIFNEGKQEGMQTVQAGDINNLFKTTAVMIFNAPYNILHGVFNFSFLGINLFSLFSFLITCSIVLFIIKMFKK